SVLNADTCPAPDPKVTNPGPAATPDPKVTNPGSQANTAPTPDPKVTNPGPRTGDPCPPAEDPAPGPGGAPAEPTAAPAPGAPPAEQADAHADAPTASLRTLATAIRTTMSGVTARVFAPPGVDVGPVEITVNFGTDKVLTYAYSRSGGTPFLHHFPHGYGQIRTEQIAITLRESTPAGPRMYAFESTVTVEPQFDITVSEIRGDLDRRCDFLGAGEPTVFWVDAEGVLHRHDNSGFLAPGYTWNVDGSALTVKRASLKRGLTLPAISWYERDLFGSIGEPYLPRGPQLLPRPDAPAGLVDTVVPVRVGPLKDGDGDDCAATFDYTIRYHPVVG
ncbi:MAG: hypothetical protein L0H84_19080, partial [Pseudonocardia sp.]|nr:hypothetical protein [Pseudonocardia sp.]